MGWGLQHGLSVAFGLGGRRGSGLITVQIEKVDIVRKPHFKYR